MGALVNFLIEYYYILAFIAILLVLTLIGYIIDNTKTKKMQEELSKEEKTDTPDIPIASIGADVKLGDTINKQLNSEAQGDVRTSEYAKDNPLNVEK